MMARHQASGIRRREPPSSDGAGFTLLEMIVSSGVFAVVMVIVVGVMLAINSAQIKAANIQVIQDNLRFSLEAMTKEMRTGTNWNLVGPSELYFERSDGITIGYCTVDTEIFKITNGANCTSGSPVTDENIAIDSLTFSLIGEQPGPADGQPRITIILRAHSVDPRLSTLFNLQTTITARRRDSS